MKDFSEIGPCGGVLTLEVLTDEHGKRLFSIEISSSSATGGSSIACIVCDYWGTPIKVTQLSWNPDAQDESPPKSDFYVTFLKSDTQGAFGHECPRCHGYWRSECIPHLWPMTCPYCGLVQQTHIFRTDAQRRYLAAVSGELRAVIESDFNGKHKIDLDEIARNATGKESGNPLFFSEISQQEKFTCSLCGIFNDILGRFGYCSSCGYRNNADHLGNEVRTILESLNKSGAANDAIKGIVSSLEGSGRNLVEQLIRRVPMTGKRREKAKRIRFHELELFSDQLNEIFGIDVAASLSKADRRLVKRMFFRRHVYEHSGGVADATYLRKSGDTSVREGQLLRDSTKDATKFAELVIEMFARLQEGFHEILPVNGTALDYLAPEKKK